MTATHYEDDNDYVRTYDDDYVRSQHFSTNDANRCCAQRRSLKALAEVAHSRIRVSEAVVAYSRNA